MRATQSPEQLAFALGALVSIATLLIHCWFDFSLHIPVNAALLACILGMTAAIPAPLKGIERLPVIGFGRYGAAALVLGVVGVGLWSYLPTAAAFRYTDLGNRLKSMLRYDAALDYYDRAIELDRGYAEPVVRIGDYNRTGALWRTPPDKLEERRAFAKAAVETYDRALKLNPYDAFVRVNRARMLDLLEDGPAAIKAFEGAIQVDPANAYTYFTFGCYYRDHGDSVRAKELFDKAAEIQWDFANGLNTYDLEQEGQSRK